MTAIPLRDGAEYDPDPVFIRELQKAYPYVDVAAELQKMRVWSISNPQKRKTRRGINRFITMWISRNNKKPAGMNLAPSHMPYKADHKKKASKTKGANFAREIKQALRGVQQSRGTGDREAQKRVLSQMEKIKAAGGQDMAFQSTRKKSG
jgi:hypothetical protein